VSGGGARSDPNARIGGRDPNKKEVPQPLVSEKKGKVSKVLSVAKRPVIDFSGVTVKREKEK
jgi:hypothetical protein